MDLAVRIGYAEAQVVSPLAAGSDHLAAALAALRCLSSVLFLHNWQMDPNITSRAMLLDDEWIERCCALVVELEALALLKTFG